MAITTQDFTATDKPLKDAYATCMRIAQNHYENFPVATFFLPYRQRISIAAIYAFARTADDFADSSSLDKEEKLTLLRSFQDQLNNIANPDFDLNSQITPPIADAPDATTQQPVDKDNTHTEIFLALADTIKVHNLPIKLLHDLLLAFMQDVTKNRYYDFQDVLNYCELSANPIGQLLLHIAGEATTDNFVYSNFICTGLQLINFMQDLYTDATELNRCYLPLAELSRCNLSVNDIKDKISSPELDKLINYQLQRIHSIYCQGSPLALQLNGTFGFYIRLIMAGGAQILKALSLRKDHFSRPTLTPSNVWHMVLRAIATRHKFMIHLTKPLALQADSI